MKIGACAGMLSALLLGSTQSAAAAQQIARLIHYGWDNPYIEELPDQLPKIKTSVFNGLSARLDREHIFTGEPYPDGDYASAKAILQTVDRSLLRDSYLAIQSKTDGVFDWSNDAHWAAAMRNMHNSVEVAKAGGFKGIVFDMEPYGKNPWAYNTQQASTRLGFAEFKALLRRRGTQMIRDIERTYPGIEIWCLYGLTAEEINVQDATSDQQLEALLKDSNWGLWPSFFAGWVNGASPGLRIIEGNEHSYYYVRRSEFQKQLKWVRQDLARLLPAGLRDKYRGLIKLGHAAYVDGVMNLHESPRYIGYYFDNDGQRRLLLRNNITNGLETSQSLVWVYSEENKWWDKPPRQDIDRAVRLAKADAKAGIIPSDDIPAIVKAKTELDRRVSIGGKIKSSSGRGYQADRFEPALSNAACVAWGDQGDYGCDFPYGSNVAIRPVIGGKTLSPLQYRFNHLTQSNWSKNFLVK
jgi:hypothetical protein